MRSKPNRFIQVPYNTDVSEIRSFSLIKVFRRGEILLAVEYRLEWFEPDGHKYTGYADYTQTEPYNAAEVFSEERFGTTASVALEDGVEWDEAWGKLVKDTDVSHQSSQRDD